MSCPGCDGKTSSCASGGTFCQKPRLGLHGRPAQCRPALPVHEREPGLFSGCHHGARARRVQGWLIRVAASSAVPPWRCRRGAAETGPDRARQLAPNLRCALRACGFADTGRTARLQTDCAADARGRAGGREPSAWRADDNQARQGCCQVAEHFWDPVGLAIVRHAYRFEHLIAASGQG